MNCSKYSYFKPSLGHSWLIAIILIVAGSFLSVVFTMLGLSEILLKYISLEYVVTMFVPLLYIVIAASRASKLKLGNPCPINKPFFGNINPFVFFAILLVCPILITVIIDPLSSLIPMPENLKALFENIFYETKLWDSILATSIMAPLFEEFLCRGIMLRGMLVNDTKPWKAIFWSALIFAVIHMNPWQGIGAFCLGLFFGWVYYKTHCIWSTVFLHFVNNFTAIVTGRLFPDMEIDASFSELFPKMTFEILYICAAVLIAGIIYYFNKNLKKNEEREEDKVVSA